MIPEGPPTSCSVGVLGSETIVETLSAVERTDGRSLEVVPVTSEAVRHQEPPAQEVDCLIIDDEGSSDGGVAVLEAIATARPELPAVFLVDEVADGVVADALSAGAADVLPRTVALDRPELCCERVLGRVEGRQRQESFRELYDNLAGVVTVHDPASGELVHANQTLCDLLGYDRDEVLAMTVSDFTADVPGYNTDRATNVAASVSEQNAPIEVEWPITTADDSVRWIESRFQTATFGGREIVLSTSVDVTERRRQERKYEQVFDNVNDVITVHDPWEGELVDVNQRLCELTGYSREALLEMGVDGFSATAEGYTSDRAYDIQQTVAATGESETVDWVVETADGEQRRLETVLSPTTIAGEDRVLVLARDVTKRRRLEQTYRDLFESVSDGLVVHDPETGEIRDVNDRYCELTGYDREELVGSNVR
ncbi:MAG: PAS domain S-box-containing protein, partial [Haloarculaceae archaeon]